MSTRICFILNFAPHYRKELLQRIDKEFACDFYFGNKTYTDISKVDYSIFKNTVEEFKFFKIYNNFYMLRKQIALAFKKYDYYVITGQPYNLSSWVLLFLNKILHKKTYIWNHGLYGHENSTQKLLKKIQFKLASGYLLYGNYAKDLMIKAGYKEDKLHVIYNSLHYSKQLKIRNQLKVSSVYKKHFNNSHPTIIFIGRLTKVKKLELLLEAMYLCFKEKVYFNMVFIGDGSERVLLEQQSRSYNLSEYCWFYGKLYDENIIGELIYNAALCVSPGNVGLTAIHALSYGCPVVTHDNFAEQMPEFEAIKDGFNGTFFKYNDLQSLKTSIKEWIVKYPKKDKELINNCFSVVDTYYNPKIQIQLLKEILHEDSSN